MKILLAATSEGVQSGASRCYLNIVKEFIRKDMDFVCLVPKKGLLSEALSELGVKTYIVFDFNGTWQVDDDYRMSFVNRFKYFAKSFYNVFAVNRIKSIIRKEKIDIVHINSISSCSAADAALKAGVPFVWHIRELLEEQMDSKFVDYKKAYCLLDKASRIIFISETVKKYYLSKHPFHNSCVIADGVDTAKYYYEKELFADESVNIGIIGRIDVQKRQHVFLEAAALLSKDYPKLKCYVVGGCNEGNYLETLKGIVKDNQMENNVIFTGFAEDSSEYTKKCDIICACSHAEAFGLITVESMLSGALVVASDSGCNLELVKNNETGFLFKCDDVNSLYSKMKHAIEHRNETSVIARNGQKKSLSFSLEANADKIIECYRQVLADSRRNNGIEN